MTGKQLKNSILQWAIQGKLVPQDPNDEPASVLLERIREEKKRLIKEGKIKKDKNETIIYRGEDNSYYEKFLATGEVKCIDDEIPFEIPASWEWARMGAVINFINGRAYKKEELLSSGKYRVLRVGNFFTNTEWYYSDLELPEDKYCLKGDLLYAWSASFGPQIWDGDKTIFHYHIWNVKYNEYLLYREYLYYFFLYDKTQVKKSTTGSTMIHVSMENMKPRLLPIPPLSEQRRIVKQIQLILPLVDRYSACYVAQNKLNDEIKENLKKSILQEAIQGRLVPQLAEEGTAEGLLAEIRKEKQKLVKDGKLKKSALSDSIIFRGDDNRYYEQIGSTTTDITEQIPFDVPANWSWVRLAAVANLYTGNSISDTDKKARYTAVEGTEYIGTKDVGFDHKVDYSNGVNIPEQYLPYFKIAPLSSVLLCIEGGSAGRKIAIIDKEVCFGNKLCCLSPYKTTLSKYIFYYLQSPIFFESFKENLAGIIGGVSVNTLKMLIMPLPPQLELQRIVKHIDELFEHL